MELAFEMASYSLDCKTRKLFGTLSGDLHSRADVDHLYLPSKSGSKGLKSIKDIAYDENCMIYHYLAHSSEPWLQTVLESGLVKRPHHDSVSHCHNCGKARKFHCETFAWSML